MDCACLWGFDGENDFTAEEIRTARKCHVCCECKRSIGKGEKYERSKT